MSAVENICLIGWGAIARRVAELLNERQAAVRIVAVAVRDRDIPRDDVPVSAQVISDPKDLTQTGATLVIEAAGRDSVAVWGEAALTAGMDFAASSTSAFVDEGVLARLRDLAKRHQSRLMIPPGALGGIDALSAAARLPLKSVEHRITKPAHAWLGTQAEDLIDLHNLTKATQFFRGTARATADAYPQNANVAVITSLAGIGLDRTTISLVADPDAVMNAHHIKAIGDFGELDLRMRNHPLVDNPKSSEMTALTLVRLIENRVSALVI